MRPQVGYLKIFMYICSMNIAFFSGSFDPPHIGHIAVANAIYTEGLAEEVWLSPTPHNPCKTTEQLSPPQRRLEMTAIAAAPHPHLRLCGIEQELPQPSYTINTLRALRERYPQHGFSLVIGADNWLIFNKWKNYRELADEFPILIYPREGYPLQIAAGYPNARAIDAPLVNISSTAIRTALERGESIAQWLPPGVEAYIREQRLYR